MNTNHYNTKGNAMIAQSQPARCFVQSLVLSLILMGSTLIPTQANAGEILVGDRLWLDMNTVTGSWNQFSNACDLVTGVCSNSVNGFDLTGYTWANVNDVNSLFNAYLAVDGVSIGPGPDGYTSSSNLQSVKDFMWIIDGDFSPTQQVGQTLYLTGWMRDAFDADNGRLGRAIDSGNQFGSDVDGFGTTLYNGKTVLYDAFLYRSAVVASVPEPSTGILMMTSVALLGLFNRRRPALMSA